MFELVPCRPELVNPAALLDVIGRAVLGGWLEPAWLPELNITVCSLSF